MRHARLLAIPAVVIAIAIPVASFAWPTNPQLGLAVAFGPGPQSLYSIVSDGAGGAIAAWTDSGATQLDIRATHVLANGVIDPVWPAGGVAVATVVGDQNWPSLVSDGAGGAIIRWSDFRNGTDYDLYAHHLLATGVMDPAWPVNGAVVSGGVGNQAAASSTGSFSSFIPDGIGGAFAVWQDSRTGEFDIYAHHISGSGVDPAWPVGGLAVCTATGIQQAPGLTTDQAGGVVVAWFDLRSGNADIYAHHVKAAGTVDPVWPADGRAVCTAALDQRYVEAITDGAGGALLVWHDRRSGTNTDLYAHHVLSDGTLDVLLPVDGIALCTAPFDQSRVRMISDGANGALVLWGDDRDGINKAVVVHHLTSVCVPDPAWPVDGRIVRSETGEAAFSGVVYQRGFVPDGVGGAMVTWTDFRNGDADIYAHHVQANGVLDPVWPAEGRGVSVAATAQGGPSAIADGQGRYLISWYDNRNGSSDGYMQRVTGAGELGGIVWSTWAQSLPQLQRGSLDWGDYDNDGDLDLLMTGTDGLAPRCYLYANDGTGALSEVATGLPGIEWSSAEWGDMDGDGDLDIAMAGWNGTPGIARIYRNDSGTFNDSNAGLPGVTGAAVAWGDFDADGDLDLLLAGRGNDNTPIALIYRNENGSWSNVDAGLTGLTACDADWGDYDDDGDLDLLLAGSTGSAPLTRVYMNASTFFFPQDLGLPNVESMDGSLGWGDVDADGDLDVLISGWDGSVRRCSIFRNDGGAFSDIDANMTGLSSGSAAWADVDNDGDLEVALSGTNGSGGATGLYRTAGATPNTSPGPPSALVSIVSGTVVTFQWAAASDVETPAGGLSYNLRVSTSPGSDFPLPSMSQPNGHRKIVRQGNAGHVLTTWRHLTNGPYYWSLQAIDGAFAGSTFAAEQGVLDVLDHPADGSRGLQSTSPNPFRAHTEIRFAQARAGHVEIAIHDASGRRVRVLERGERAAGQGRVTWDGRGDGGQRLPSGLYFVRIQLAGERFSGKVVLTD